MKEWITLSTNPTDLPGTSVRVMTLPEAPLPSPFAMQRDNATAVQALIDRTKLPAPSMVPEPDVVRVMLADIDDMALWLAELGGRVSSYPTPGVRAWRLQTSLPATRVRAAVAIEVYALATSTQDILPALRSAAAAA